MDCFTTHAAVPCDCKSLTYCHIKPEYKRQERRSDTRTTCIRPNFEAFATAHD